MKKRILFILIACLLCQSFIIGFNKQNYADYYNSIPKTADDDYESNDSYDQATLLKDLTWSDILILQDIDWFVLSLNASDNLTIIIQTDCEFADMEINFYESDGITPVQDIIIGGQGNLWMIAISNISMTADYYFSLFPLGEHFSYSLYLSDDFDDKYEDNDVIADSITINSSFEISYVSLYCLDDDWFKIYLEEGSNINISYIFYKTESYEFNFLGTNGVSILNGIQTNFDEYEELIYVSVNFNESVIDDTGYYYFHILSDSPTIYSFSYDLNRNVTFENYLISISLNQYTNYEIRLCWDFIEKAELFHIFRETSPITTVNGLTPIATNHFPLFWDHIEENGTYYYVVVANNGSYNTSISNCVNVTIKSYEEIPISLNLHSNGQLIDLDWYDIQSGEFYYIFRENSPITSVNGLTPYDITDDSMYNDFIMENGTYYYVVIANNGTYNSSISNCESIEIMLYPFNEIVPELKPIVPPVDEDGKIIIFWDEVINASMYYIFRETSPITSTDGLTPIAEETSSSYYDQISENGTYYYAIVANNGSVNCSISNCESVNCLILPFYEQEPYIYHLELSYPHSYRYVDIGWTPILNAIEYYIYRDTSPISNIDGLEPIATVDHSSYQDFILTNGTYYYIIVANNGSINSKPSSCKSIEISFTSFNPFSEYAPILYEINPNPSYTGIITIEWEKVEDSTNYYIYRETSPITSIDGLTPKFSSFDQYNQTWHETQYYTDNITENGTYYYVVVAYNGEIYSSISNCESVEVIPEREKIKISGFNILTFGLVISGTASIIIVSIRKRRNS